MRKRNSVAAASTPIQRAVPSGTLPPSGRRTSDSNSAKSVGMGRCSTRVKRVFLRLQGWEGNPKSS